MPSQLQLLAAVLALSASATANILGRWGVRTSTCPASCSMSTTMTVTSTVTNPPTVTTITIPGETITLPGTTITVGPSNPDEPTEVETETTPRETIVPPAVKPINCNHNNCLRQFLRHPQVTGFCATYTTTINTATTDLPDYVSQCHADPTRVSSACSCVVTGKGGDVKPTSTKPDNHQTQSNPAPTSAPDDTCFASMITETFIETTTYIVTVTGSAPSSSEASTSMAPMTSSSLSSSSSSLSSSSSSSSSDNSSSSSSSSMMSSSAA